MTMTKSRKEATLIANTVKNINLAVELLEFQQKEFEDDECFLDIVVSNTSVEVDDFIVDMAVSKPYIDDTIDALKKMGYRVKDSSNQEWRPQDLAKHLVSLLGMKAAVAMVINQE